MMRFIFNGAPVSTGPLFVASEVVDYVETRLRTAMSEDARAMLLLELEAAASRADTEDSSFMAARSIRQDICRIAGLMREDLRSDLGLLLEEAVCSSDE